MKALSVFSGGLDSMLASALIRDQGIQVLALFFETPFFPASRAVESARAMDLPLNLVDITERHLEIVKNPEHGYGENMNPCIDCHTLMIRMAGEMLQAEGAHFIITGEVLGQRPMSQNRKALSIVAEKSGFSNVLLRPLSAKKLPPTLPEEKGWVDRQRLMDFSGRSRKPQMALAEKMNIRGYPSPAGGCLLTDIVFSRRLKDLLKSSANPARREIELLKLGRHFRLEPGAKVVIGRNKGENQAIRALSHEADLLVKTVSVPGPTALVVGRHAGDHEDMAAVMTASYSDAADGEETDVRLTHQGSERVVKAKVREKASFKGYMI